ncbi:MAG TPA: 3-methyl-2-oxobutanoate dehydrogenase subunit VorB [Elusimicrobiales bacterium]|nr:3-methyl-2-oxobutanoate dehydrogenase subunit VorB [Elusimicrobiales bacterium]
MSDKILMKGNDALAEGAVRAGCRFFAGYPITPQNEVPEYMSWRLPQTGGAFVQAESETAAINMLYGAAATGIRTMTSSSSPGISLKQEGISYCAGADLPIFFANVVRGGPGLGNITGAQGDYFQSTRGGGHGDYRVFVLAPASVQEMAALPSKAYALAEKYRMPAMVLTDGVLGQMLEPVDFNFETIDASKLPDPKWAIGANKGRERRTVCSYDLDEGKLETMTLERAKRYKEAQEKEVLYDTRMIEDAEVVLVAYGTAARACMSAIKIAREKGIKAGLFRPITLWPFPTKEIAKLAEKAKCFLSVEMSLGQMVVDVRLAVNGKKPVYLHARPSGAMPVAEEIAAAAQSALKGSGPGLYGDFAPLN